MMLWAGWYLVDTYSASTSVQNLIFVVPAVAVCAVVYLIIVAKEFFTWSADRYPSAPAATGGGTGDGTGDGKGDDKVTTKLWARPLALMALLGAYVLLLPTIGFDVATALLVAGGLVIQGERRPLFVLIYSVVFAGLVTAGFAAMMSLDMPTLLL